jgi:hypothetical protein
MTTVPCNICLLSSSDCVVVLLGYYLYWVLYVGEYVYYIPAICKASLRNQLSMENVGCFLEAAALASGLKLTKP